MKAAPMVRLPKRRNEDSLLRNAPWNEPQSPPPKVSNSRRDPSMRTLPERTASEARAVSPCSPRRVGEVVVRPRFGGSSEVMRVMETRTNPRLSRDRRCVLKALSERTAVEEDEEHDAYRRDLLQEF